MSGSPLHDKLTAEDGIHSMVSWEFATENDRLNFIPNKGYPLQFSQITASDKHKVGYVESTGDYYTLLDTTVTGSQSWKYIPTTVVSGTNNHNTLMNLDDDDHKHYLLADGTRLMSGNLNMNEFSVTGTNTIDFVYQQTLPTHKEGCVFYDYNNHTLALYNDQPDVTHQLGQELHLRVVNKIGGTITNGSAVYINGAQGNRPTVNLAIATAGVTGRAIGLATHDIPNNKEGIITLVGQVSLDTTGFTAGVPLWVSDTIPGGLTQTPPTGSSVAWFMGISLNSTANGVVNVQPFSPSALRSLFDVNDGTPISGKYLVADGIEWTGADFSTDVISVMSSSQTGSINHNLIGDLDSDDHLQYYHISGTRALQGDFDVNSNNIINVNSLQGNQLTGSLTKLNNGDAYLIADGGTTITTGSNDQITIASPINGTESKFEFADNVSVNSTSYSTLGSLTLDMSSTPSGTYKINWGGTAIRTSGSQGWKIRLRNTTFGDTHTEIIEEDITSSERRNISNSKIIVNPSGSYSLQGATFSTFSAIRYDDINIFVERIL